MEDEFLDAALTGNLLEVIRLIAKGCSANSKNEVKSTHLSVYIQAACFHSVEQSQQSDFPPSSHNTLFMPGL